MLPAENVTYFPSSDMDNEDMNISTRWCFDVFMSSPRVHLNFVEPVYLVYAVGSFYNHSTGFSITYKNSSSESVTYTNLNGIYVRSKLVIYGISYIPYSGFCL